MHDTHRLLNCRLGFLTTQQSAVSLQAQRWETMHGQPPLRPKLGHIFALLLFSLLAAFSTWIHMWLLFSTCGMLCGFNSIYLPFQHFFEGFWSYLYINWQEACSFKLLELHVVYHNFLCFTNTSKNEATKLTWHHGNYRYTLCRSVSAKLKMIIDQASLQENNASSLTFWSTSAMVCCQTVKLGSPGSR